MTHPRSDDAPPRSSQPLSGAARAVSFLAVCSIAAGCASTGVAVDAPSAAVQAKPRFTVTVEGGGPAVDVTDRAELPCRSTSLQVDGVAPSALEVGGGLSRSDGQQGFRIDPVLGAFAGFEVTFSGDAPVAARSLRWTQNIDCLGWEGAVGDAGTEDRPDGAAGPKISAFVTKVRSPSAGVVLFAVLEHDGKHRYAIAPGDATLVIYSNGGDGARATPSRRPGKGGDGGRIAVVVDERFPELINKVQFHASGGRGGDGITQGQPGAGEVSTGDVLLDLIARSDLPRGLALLDAPIAIKQKLRPRRPVPPPPPPKSTIPVPKPGVVAPKPPAPKPLPRPAPKPIFIPPPPKPAPPKRLPDRSELLSPPTPERSATDVFDTRR
ncbi:MAG: hypothetical protein HOW73_27695 [Polyangiaceae bacterium]|nr:hypothetical protein [Polyangiaceae bacterium]